MFDSPKRPNRRTGGPPPPPNTIACPTIRRAEASAAHIPLPIILPRRCFGPTGIATADMIRATADMIRPAPPVGIATADMIRPAPRFNDPQ